MLVNYAYDAWGKVVSVTDADGNEITDMSHIGHINPIRYRSYYYDGETNLYYLNSRYYSPDICRFLNADGYVQTGRGVLDKNMFAYCVNNPIHYVDPNGSVHFCRTSVGICPICGRNFWNRCPGSKPPRVEADYTATTPSGVEVSIYVDESKARQADGGKKSVRAVDKRKTGGNNPNIQVIDSYKIVNPTIQYEIIDVLLEYDKNNPNDPAWGRTREKMKIEWDMHNLGYYGASILGQDNIKGRAQDVDFDHNDEETKFYEYFFK